MAWEEFSHSLGQLRPQVSFGRVPSSRRIASRGVWQRSQHPLGAHDQNHPAA